MLTHPDILKMERDGFLGDEPEVVGECCECGCDVHAGSGFDVHGDIVCDDCDMKYMKRFRSIGA